MDEPCSAEPSLPKAPSGCPKPEDAWFKEAKPAWLNVAALEVGRPGVEANIDGNDI